MKWHEIKLGAISVSCSECPHIRGLIVHTFGMCPEHTCRAVLNSVDSIEGLKSELSCL